MIAVANRFHSKTASLLVAATVMAVAPAQLAFAESRGDLQADARAAVASLYTQVPGAKALGEQAAAILVFPAVVKASFIVGGQYGEGVLLQGGKIDGYYNTITGSVGYQAGVEKFSYALFLMNPSALKYLNKSDGWELGVGPEITLVDVGAAASLSTTTAKKSVYAFFFDPKGLMGGVSIQGTKVTKIHK
ncbi:MAG TPA: lipid-binding SYLF domain-containing protein [Candidatus Binatia bacterium]|jgi:lipid-binding SYLF domain-containing protein